MKKIVIVAIVFVGIFEGLYMTDTTPFNVKPSILTPQEAADSANAG